MAIQARAAIQLLQNDLLNAKDAYHGSGILSLAICMLQAPPSSACSHLTTNMPLRSLQANRVLEHIDIGVECYAVQAVP